MKVLRPALTILLTSHMKPYLKYALGSVISQVRKDFECVVIDSGQWIGGKDDVSQDMRAIHKEYSSHPLVNWVTTGELPGLNRRKCPVAWATNEAIRAGLVRGRHVCTFYDDDIYMPEFTERMVGFLDEHPEHRAVWCSQHRALIRPDGSSHVIGGIPAFSPKKGPSFDCVVDGAQIMFRKDVLDEMGDPWLDENPALDVCRHSDGIFLNRLGTIVGTVPNIPDFLCVHRNTPLSTYTAGPVRGFLPVRVRRWISHGGSLDHR